VAPALPLPLSFASVGFFFGFFGFDFLADFFVFGVFGFAAFAFVVDFFDRDRFAVAGFAVVCFGFVVFAGDERRPDRGRGQADRMRGGGCGKQQQRGEQEGQQDRQFAHGPFIGARCRSS